MRFCVRFLTMKYYNVVQWYYVTQEAVESENPPYRERPIVFDIPLTIKVNFGIIMELHQVAEFKRRKPGTLARELLLEGMATIERDPYFKKFMRDRAENAEREKRLAKKTNRKSKEE